MFSRRFRSFNKQNTLFSIFLAFTFVDLEVAELICSLTGGHYSEIVAELILLQELLREVFKVPLRERRSSSYRNPTVKQVRDCTTQK
jgi:hypothetical protein